MGVRLYKPTSPGRRDASVNDYAELTTDKPEKSLCKRIKKKGGRNHYGITTVRFRGGGARTIYRIIDFKRKKDGVPATISTVEYDPNRDCFISLVTYADGEKRYILAPLGIQVGDKIPSVTLAQMTGEGPAAIGTEEIFSGKKVVLFALPGAYTPTCSARHVPATRRHVYCTRTRCAAGVPRTVALRGDSARR